MKMLIIAQKNKDRRENVNKCQNQENWPGKRRNITKVVKT